jgi:20S proteasome alpha/beta subunit
MTILAGVITKNAIVIASDSQESHPEGSKENDLVKIHVLKIGGSEVLAGLCGEVILTSRFLELLPITEPLPESAGYTVVEKVARHAMRILRRELRVNQHDDCSPEMFDDIMLKRQRRCSALIAYCEESEPRLFGIKINDVIPLRASRSYMVDGSGAEIGKYLLADNTDFFMDRDLATAMAIYAVELAKTHNNGCGGDIQCAVLEYILDWWKPGSGRAVTALLSGAKIAELSKLLAVVEPEAKKQRNDKLRELLGHDITGTIAAALSKNLEDKKDELRS